MIEKDEKKILFPLHEASQIFMERNRTHFFLLKKIVLMVTARKNPTAGLPFYIIFPVIKIIRWRIYKPLLIYVCPRSSSRIIKFRFCLCLWACNPIPMASKSVACILLVLNLVLYFVVTVITSWAVNHGIERSRETGIYTESFHQMRKYIKFQLIYIPIFSNLIFKWHSICLHCVHWCKSRCYRRTLIYYRNVS